MRKYVYRVEQTIEVTANSPEEAIEKLPTYPTFYEGQGWVIDDEHIDLLYSEEIKEVKESV